MGILTGLLTLPLAPVRGTVWLAEKLVEEAERELGGDEASLRRRLAEADVQHDLGRLTDEEYEALEDELLERLERLREARRA